MTTIRRVDRACLTGKTRDAFEAVLRREANVFGATAVSNTWRILAHHPHYLRSTWRKEQVVMRGRAQGP